MHRSILLVVLAAALAAPPAFADEPAPTEPAPTEPAPTEPAPIEPAAALLIPDGVTIAGVSVGGLSPDQAAAVVQGSFDQPVILTLGKKRWRATPADLGAELRLGGAVERALAAAPGEAVNPVVHVRGRYVRAYVAYLDLLLSHRPRDATLRLKKFRPFLTKPREGVKVLREATTLAIVRALRSNERGPIPLAVETVQPKVTLANFGPVIVIRRESKKLYYYQGMRYKKRFGVATGQSSYPTPLGRFTIVVKQLNPWWYPPNSAWAKGRSPVPPGPGNPLGTRWMGLSVPLVGIHGTPDAASIGYSASHGCIRMRIPDAEWLFNHVALGTTVFIVNA